MNLSGQKREAAIFSNGFPTEITLYIGQAPLPRTGDEVEVKNFKDGEIKTYVVTERLVETNEYKAAIAE